LRNDWNTISTPYAAIKSVQLPDGSTAVLNAHSTIRFHKDFAGHQREVWLTGEAFFEVRHITLAGKAQRFVVHAGATDVEVLGTEFNVKTGDHTTGVMLRRGKVQFGVPNTTLQTIMQPSDYCQYNTTPQGITTRVVNPVLFTGWMEHKYRFENTSAYEVCRTLEEYFGYEFIIKKTSMIDQRISGTLELSNEQVMFSALGVLLNASVAKSGNKVIIR
jgi:ferric-dicitrate binding protein FerR (iron transport regulator)